MNTGDGLKDTDVSRKKAQRKLLAVVIVKTFTKNLIAYSLTKLSVDRTEVTELQGMSGEWSVHMY